MRQLESSGAPPEVVNRARRSVTADTAPSVLPENTTAWNVFCALQTQWVIITPAMGGAFYTGLRYEVVGTVMDYLGVRKAQRPAVFEDIRLMEMAALGVLNQKG